MTHFQDTKYERRVMSDCRKFRISEVGMLPNLGGGDFCVNRS